MNELRASHCKMSFDTDPSDYYNLSSTNKLGSGGSAKVFVAKSKCGTKTYALKFEKRNRDRIETHWEDIVNEVSI